MQPEWRAIFQSFQHCIEVEPTKKWFASTERPLAQIKPEDFSGQALSWLAEPLSNPRPQLSAPGSHILKNLVWCAISINDPQLDHALTSLIDIPWKKQQPMDKVAGALACLWSHRAPPESRSRLEYITKIYGYAGGKIDLYYRKVCAPSEESLSQTP